MQKTVSTVQAAVNLFLLISLAAALIDPRHLHAAAVTDEGQPSLNTIDQSAVTSKCTSRAKVGV